MIDYKDCIAPYGKRATPPPAPFPRRKKRVPRKCSTCGNKECRSMFYVADFIRCVDWKPGWEAMKGE